MAKNKVITVQNVPITVSVTDIDYICITDMAAAKSDNSRAGTILILKWSNSTTLKKMQGYILLF